MAANNEEANVDQDVKSDDKIASSNQQEVSDVTSVQESQSGDGGDGVTGLYGYSKLHRAASNGQATLLKSLLAEDPNSVNGRTVDGGYTPLHLAASAGHAECVEVLLKYHKTDIHVIDAFGRTPLEIAEQYFKTTVAKLLRSHGIIKAAREEMGNYLDILLKTLTDPNRLIDKCYDLALMAAVEKDRCSNAEKLILAGAANINDTLKSAKQAEIKLMLLMVKAVIEDDHQLIMEIKRISRNELNKHNTLLPGSGETLPHSVDADQTRSLKYTILYSEEMTKYINNGGRIRTRVPIKLAIKREKPSIILDDLLSITNIDLGTGSVGWSDLNLTEADINWIRSLPKHMTIKQLNLSHNRLSTLRMNVASYLNKCTKLELHYNNIKAIPKSILELPSIKELNVSHNKVSALPNVSWSASLAQLNLSHNELETLPDGVTERCADSMKVLQLDHNHLREVPDCVCFLCKLNTLDISNNSSILVLPVGLGRLKELKQLNLNGLHNLQDPPSSICENSATCLSYLKSQFVKQSRYYRMKLMLVGKQHVGKTTMVGCLQGKQYPEGSTIGVDIGDWSYWLSMFKPTFTFSVWDFAGQEEYYATHQVFLSKRSLYLAVWNVLDERKGIEELRPWLNNIISQTPESRIIIVGTHFDRLISELGSRERANAKCDEYRHQLNQIIEHRYVKNVVKVMFVGLKGRFINVSALKDEIYRTAEQCTDNGHLVMGCSIPTSYNKVDNLLKSSKVLEPILHATQFKSKVRSLNQPDLQSEDEIKAVTLFLHNIGSLLHFDDHRHNLDDLYFVKPQWLCKLMSTVITVKERNKYVKDGKITKQDLEKLFQNSDHNAYPEKYLEQYLALFNRFEIALPLNKEGDLLLIPCFLSPEIPEMVNNLRADCCYQRMFGFQNVTTPPGLWSRLLSRLMNSVTAIKNILIQDNEEDRGLLYWKKGLCWHSGDALFIIESCQLQAEDDGISITYSSSVTTYSSNVEQEGLLGQLVNIVQLIVREWFPGLDKQLEQLFICYKCAKNNHQGFSKLPQLLDCVANSKTFIKCKTCQEHLDLNILAPDIVLHDMECVLKFESIQIQYDDGLIWSGKFGKVYHAKLDSGIPVIAKLYNTNKDSQIENYEVLIQIFRAEVAYIRRIKHPCLVDMVGVCKYPNVALVMEDCLVGSLDSYVLKELHSVSRIVVFRIAAQIASALHFLHSIPVIYRDLSADKVLIWSLSLDHMVNCKLAGLEVATYEDFGHLRSSFANKQVAPEVNKQAIYDKRVDIYSLGVLFSHVMQRSYPTEDRTEVEMPLIVSVPDSELRHIGNLARSCCSEDPAERPELEEIMRQLCDPIFQLMMHVTTVTLEGTISCTCTVEVSASYCTTEAWMCCNYTDRSEIVVFLLSSIILELEKRYYIEDHKINNMLSHGHYVWATSIQAGGKGSLLKFDGNKKEEYIKVPIKSRADEDAGNVPSGDYGVSLACSDNHVYVGTARGQCLMYSTNISENSVPIREVNVSGIRSMIVIKNTSMLWVSTRVSTVEDQILFVNLNSFQDRKEVNIDDYRVGKLLLSSDEEIVWTVHIDGQSVSAWNAQKQKLICLFNLHKLLGEEVDQQNIRITAASAILDTLWVGLYSGHILVLCAALPQEALIITKPFNQKIEVLVPIYGKDDNITMISIGKDYQLEKQSGVQKQKSLDVVLWEVVGARRILKMNYLSTGKAWLDDASLNEVTNLISDAQRQLQLAIENQLVGQETQSKTTLQIQLEAKKKTQQSDLEYKLFMQYHNKLSEVPSLVDLTSHFVAANIITSSDAEAVTNTITTESQTAALRKLLNKISLAFLLGHDGSELCDKMLEIMQMYGDDTAQQLATDMLETIVKQRSIVSTTSEKQQVIQETLQAQSALRETTQQSDLEYKLFMQYHSKLSEVPSLVDLTSHFVAANIITSFDAEAVTNTITTESQTAALRKLLNKILLAFSFELFDKMLEIMQMYGDDIVQQLATDMLETIVKQRSSAPTTSGEEVRHITNLVPSSSSTFDHEEMIVEEHPEFVVSSGEEVHFINNLVPVLSKTFDHRGGEMIIEEHDVTITVPELAISEGDEVEFQAIVSLTGPYQLPDGYDLVSALVWIEADYRFRKLVKITIPHFASIENLDQRFDVVVLTANEKDLVLNENGDSVLQLHESVYDYQYEVNDDYCDYYTDHFCSKCLARRRSFIFRLFNRLTFSPGVVPNPSRTRLIVFFCVPDDYATADELLIELCICYSLKYCLQIVRKSYEGRKMLSKKSNSVPWTIAIDNQRCQNFCLSCGECPGWVIKPIGLEKIKVRDLDFHTYASPEDLRAEEELNVYPPRFKISVNRLSHGQKLETEFNIVLENDGVLATDEVRKFPLIITKLVTETPSDQQFTTDVNRALTSTTASTTGPSSASNASVASSYQSAIVSDDSSSTAMTVAASVGSPSVTDIAATTTATTLDQTALADSSASPTTAGHTFLKQSMGLIVQGDVYNIYQSQQPQLGIEYGGGGNFNSLECFATDITESVDVGTILPNLISHGLLTPEQRDHLTHPLHTSAKKQQELCRILLTMDERCVKKFLQSLSETGDYNPHKQLLNKIQSKLKEATDDVS